MSCGRAPGCGFPDGSLLCVNVRREKEALLAESFRRCGARALCAKYRGLPQFDNTLRRKSSAKKEHKKTRPYPQATDIVAKSSGFVKCLMQISPKNSPFARSARTPGDLLQKNDKLMTTFRGKILKKRYNIRYQGHAGGYV